MERISIINKIKTKKLLNHFVQTDCLELPQRDLDGGTNMDTVEKQCTKVIYMFTL